jgi:aspartyl/asparaginyl-tRNA synthetase
MSISERLIKSNLEEVVDVSGWVRTVRTSSSSLAFCNLNDGSSVNYYFS